VFGFAFSGPFYHVRQSGYDCAVTRTLGPVMERILSHLTEFKIRKNIDAVGTISSAC
jgi:hypothetical protein